MKNLNMKNRKKLKIKNNNYVDGVIYITKNII